MTETTGKQSGGISAAPGNRDYGIDCVKIVAAVFVVVHHVIGMGFSMPDDGGMLLRFCWCFLENVSLTCINLFALASGFLCVESARPCNRLPRLWRQVFFTGAVITSAFAVTGHAVTPADWFKAFFPVITGEYWYVTAYFLLMLHLPLVNPGLHAMTKDQCRRLLVFLMLLLSVPSLLVHQGDPFVLKKGYCFAWLLVVYCLGAYWRLHVAKPPRATVCLSILAVCSLSFLVPSVGKRVFSGELGTWFGDIDYLRHTSPFNVAMSLALFGLFRHVSIKSRRIQKTVVVLSGASLGIYLWHVQPLMWHGWWKPFLKRIVLVTPCDFLWRTVAMSVIVFLAALALELLRQRLFSAIGRLVPTARIRPRSSAPPNGEHLDGARPASCKTN